jgi:hypothetical protein
MEGQGDREHSIVGASGFSRWSVCPGSVQLQQYAESLGYSGSSEYAREGTVAHEVAADCIENDRDTWMWVNEQVFLTKDGVAEVWTVDADMAEAVQVWVDTIRQDMQEYFDDTGEWPTVYVEIRFDLSDIREGMFGTSDITMLLPKWDLVRVYDYKHGAGIPVEAYRNGQLMYYGVGALHELKHEGSAFENAEFVIVQPRNYHGMGPVRRWRTTVDELAGWMDNELLPAVDRTRDENAALEAGDHCRFCPAKLICPELQDIAREFLDMAEKSPKPLTDEDIAAWLGQKQALQHFLKALDDEAFNRMLQGHNLPGFKLVKKQAKREWADGAEEALKDKLGEKAYETKLKTPAQVEKMSGMGDLVRQHSHKPDTGRTLAPESDSRPSLTPVSPQDAFGHL